MRIVLTVPYVVTLMITVGLVGFLSFRNGQQAIYTVTTQLRSEITARIEQHLKSYLDLPHLINQINADALQLGQLDIYSPDEHYFWRQAILFDTTATIYYANEQGGFVGAKRQDDGSLTLNLTEDFVGGPILIYSVDDMGNRLELIDSLPTYDPRVRPWYSAAKQAEQPVWSEIYLFSALRDLGITASQPVYDPSGELWGVLAVDLTLSQISDFLKELDIGKTGEAFIIERSGLIVASSTDEKPYITNADGQQERLHASKSDEPLISQTFQYLQEAAGDYTTISDIQYLELDIQGKRHFLQVTPYYDPRGIDWLIVVAIPEADFMAQINANNRQTLAVSGLALLAAILIGILLARWVSRPIQSMNQAAQALAAGEWQRVPPAGWITELNMLATSFNQMIVQREKVEEAERKQRTLAEALAEVSTIMNSTLDLDQVMEYILVNVGRVVPHDAANIQVLDEQGVSRVIACRSYEAVGLSSEQLKALHFQVDQLANMKAMFETKQPNVIPNVLLNPTWKRIPATEWIRSNVGAPIVIDEAVNGFIFLDSATPDFFDETHAQRLQTFAAQAAVAIQNAQLFEQVQRYATDLEERVSERTEELEQANQQLLELGQMKDQFVSNVSHELRTPISNIKLYLELMLRKPDRQEAYMDTLQRETGRLERIVEDLLKISRIDQGQIALTLVPLDLNTVAEEYITDRLLLAEERGLTLKFDAEPDIPSVLADRIQVGQVFSILLTNAFLYTPSGGRITVRTRLRRKAGKKWVGISITDTGPGITDDELPHLFDRFFRGQAGRGSGVPGTGLGLAIAKEIIEQHTGRFEVESTPGRGSTFSIWFPAHEENISL
nr:GAF domain-containing protein [Anaerolineae bacterium]